MTASSPVNQFELEARVVGAILARGDALYDLPAGFAAPVLKRETFRRAFEGIDRLAKAKRLPSGPVDVALLVSDGGLPDSARSELALAESAADSIANRASVADNARALLDRHRRESLGTLLTRAGEALRGDTATEEITGRLVARLLDLDAGERPETVTFREAALSTLDLIEGYKSEDPAKHGKGMVIRTGFADLDAILKIRKGNQIIIGARPGVGKTTLAFNIADNVAQTDQGGKVLIHSLEMSVPELVTLALSRAAEVDSQEFFEETPWGSSVWGRLQLAASARAEPDGGNLLINDSHHSLGAICRITEKAHRKHGLALVVVDYLQLVDVQLGKNANREQVVATVSRTLKLLAQRLQVPIIALSQLNREPEKRPQPRARRGEQDDGQPKEIPAPKLHELRESGAIEQDANAVVFLHNPYAESVDPIQRACGPYDLTVAKQRLGKKGRVRLWADLKFSRFRPFTNRTEGA